MDSFESSLTILVVDDEAGIRNLLVDTLRALGYAVLESETTAAALKFLESQKVDLVMSDYYMPDESGGVLLKKIKLQWPFMPVIMISGYVDEATKDQLMVDGADGFLAKPFRIKQLEEIIAAALLKYDNLKNESSRDSKLILVTDDDGELRKFICAALNGFGFQTIEASSGGEAMQLIESRRLGLVITDFMLTDSNGVDLIRFIRSKRPNLPVVIITGYPLAYSKEMAEVDGINGYLVKPFRIGQIKEIVEKILGRI